MAISNRRIVAILPSFCPRTRWEWNIWLPDEVQAGDTRQEPGFEDLLPVSIRGPAWREGSSSQDIWWDINIITIDHTHLKWVHDSPLVQAIIVIIRCWISINEFLVAACRCWVTDIMSRALTQCWVDCCDHIHYTVHGRSPADTTRRVKTFWYSSVLIFTTGMDLPRCSVRMQKLMLWMLRDIEIAEQSETRWLKMFVSPQRPEILLISSSYGGHISHVTPCRTAVPSHKPATNARQTFQDRNKKSWFSCIFLLLEFLW